MLPSFSDTSGWAPLVNTSNVQPNSGIVSLDLLTSMGNGRDNAEHGTEIQLKQSSPSTVVGSGFGNSKVKQLESLRLGQEDAVANTELTGGNKAIVDESKGVEENKLSETQDGHGKVDEGGATKDEKGMRLFKNVLVEFVKEILKPTWKEGRMSREDHKNVVKKVVDKVSSTIQVDQVSVMFQTQNYQTRTGIRGAFSKERFLNTLAYVERSLKKDS